MNEADTTTEEATIKTTTQQVEPQARGEAPQKVYEKRKQFPGLIKLSGIF